MRCKHMVGHNVRRQGCVRTHSYSLSISKLQEMGFITELWISKKGGLALRWAKRGEQWSVTSTGIRHIQDQLENIGKHALLWATSTERGLGNECNYAVREV